MGDPSGIGPEIIVKALATPLPGHHYQVYGSLAVFQQTAALLGCSLPHQGVEWVETAVDTAPINPGQPDRQAGVLQIQSLEAALDAVLQGRAHALCTAPITKAVARSSGWPFPGHTEFLAHRCDIGRFAMMLAGPSLRVVPLTGHIPLREVPRRISRDRVAEISVLVLRALQADFGLDSPRVALAALNPHAGEQGMLGQEERTVLEPGLRAARQEMARAGVAGEFTGPLPADTLFTRPGAWDAVICCYHDQAMLPIKTVHPDDSVNITLGLPLVRTSPAHGSAHDIAGQGKAREASMIAALDLAGQVVIRRRGYSGGGS